MALLCAAPAAAQQAPAPEQGEAAAQSAQPIFPVMVVDRQRVLTDSRAARALEETEKRLRREVEAQLEAVKSELEAEERELTALRDDLDPEEFQNRTREFDRRVRRERLAAQERGARLLRFLENARTALRSALPRVLEELRRRKGAAMVLDTASTAAIDPRLDVTAEAIALYDAEMGDVRFDPPEGLLAE